MPTMKARKISVQDAATLAGVTRQTVSAWIAAGRLTGERDGRKIMVDESAVSALTRHTCRRCGKPTGPRSSWCSPACRQAAYRERAAARPPPPPDKRAMQKALKVVLNRSRAV